MSCVPNVPAPMTPTRIGFPSDSRCLKLWLNMILYLRSLVVALWSHTATARKSVARPEPKRWAWWGNVKLPCDAFGHEGRVFWRFSHALRPQSVPHAYTRRATLVHQAHHTHPQLCYDVNSSRAASRCCSRSCNTSTNTSSMLSRFGRKLLPGCSWD